MNPFNQNKQLTTLDRIHHDIKFNYHFYSFQ